MPPVIDTKSPLTVPALPPGCRVGEFRIDALHAVVGSVAVYAGREQDGPTDVVIREYLPSRIVTREGVEVMPLSAREAPAFNNGRHRFLRDARLLTRVVHPSLAVVLRSWEQNGTAYVAMPRYRGQTLDRVLSSTAFRPGADWVERFVRPLLDLLCTLHRRGIVGIALSPSDVMLVEGMHPVVMRLRLRADESVEEAHSPEPMDAAWSDIQALALLIQGLIPNHADSASYPNGLRSAVADAASGEPGRRPNDVREFMDAVGCRERRRRARSVAELALSRAARVQSASSGLTTVADVQIDDRAASSNVAAARTLAQSEPAIALDMARADVAEAKLQAMPQSAVAAEMIVDAAERSAPRRLSLVAATAAVAALAGWLIGSWDVGTEAQRELPSATRAPSVSRPAVQPSPRTEPSVGESAPRFTGASPAHLSSPAARPAARASARDGRKALPASTGGASATERLLPADPRCSDLLARLSLGKPLSAADAANLDRFCR